MTATSRFRLVLITLLFASSAAMARRGPLTFSLAFTPTTATNEESPTLDAKALERTLRIETVDARNMTDPAIIGDATDDDDSHFEVRTTTDVLAFGSDVLQKLATGWGLRLDKGADTVLTVSIAKWFITETNQAFGASYAADVTLRGEFHDASGATSWRGVAQGDARRFGQDKSPANYNEVSSDAVAEALAKLLSEPAFQDALAGRPPKGAAGSGSAPTESSMSPDALLQELTDLAKGGFSQGFLVDFVKKRSLATPLTTADMIKWKQAGIPEAVITAAGERGGRPAKEPGK